MEYFDNGKAEGQRDDKGGLKFIVKSWVCAKSGN